jgi:hypothetical protein
MKLIIVKIIWSVTKPPIPTRITVGIFAENGECVQQITFPYYLFKNHHNLHEGMEINFISKN